MQNLSNGHSELIKSENSFNNLFPFLVRGHCSAIALMMYIARFSGTLTNQSNITCTKNGKNYNLPSEPEDLSSHTQKHLNTCVEHVTPACI